MSRRKLKLTGEIVSPFLCLDESLDLQEEIVFPVFLWRKVVTIRVKKQGNEYAVLDGDEVKFKSPDREEAEEIGQVLLKGQSRKLVTETITALFKKLTQECRLSAYRARAMCSTRLDILYKEAKAQEPEEER